MALVQPKRMTAAEFEARYANKDGRAELIHGEAIEQFVQEHNLGKVDGAETGFTIQYTDDTESVLAPDLDAIGRDGLPGFELPVQKIFRRVKTFEP